MIFVKSKYLKKKKRKQKEKVIKLIQKYFKFIFAFVSGLAAVLTFCFNYYEKTSETYFSEVYFSMQIGNDLEKRLENNNYASYYQEMLKYPTFENEISQMLKKKDYQDYYIIYLLIRQNGNYEAKDLSIKLKNQKNDKILNIKVPFALAKNEGIKIPIAICKLDYNIPSDYINKKFDFKDCLDTVYQPLEMSYHNKYLFSNKDKEIRKLNNYNFYIEGEAVAAVGSTNEQNDKEWFLK